jgi:hypothetical protein
MPSIQDRHDPLEEIDELVEHLAPPRLDRRAVLCGVLGLMLLMTMLLIAVGVIPLYDWRSS